MRRNEAAILQLDDGCVFPLLRIHRGLRDFGLAPTPSADVMLARAPLRGCYFIRPKNEEQTPTMPLERYNPKACFSLRHLSKGLAAAAEEEETALGVRIRQYGGTLIPALAGMRTVVYVEVREGPGGCDNGAFQSGCFETRRRLHFGLMHEPCDARVHERTTLQRRGRSGERAPRFLGPRHRRARRRALKSDSDAGAPRPHPGACCS
jgi:hypothetical protein